MMTLLALETSTEACSVALWHQERCYHRYEYAPRLQTQFLLPMIESVLAEANIPLSAVNYLAYSRGPGAFTGVRIAAAAIQALALAQDIPVIAVSSLQTIAQGAYRRLAAQNVLAVFDARMNEVYVAGFTEVNGLMQASSDETVCAPQMLPDSLLNKQFTAVGNGAEVYAEILQAQCQLNDIAKDFFPDAQDIIPLALAQLASVGAQAAEQALPVYLRDDVWKKLPGR
jgi:tRNA threonylcarbamoyladenosine biosynthesis protein TsaB